MAGRVLGVEPKVKGCAAKWRLCLGEGKVSGICCWGHVGLGRAVLPVPLVSSVCVAWEDVGAGDRSVADVLHRIGRLKAVSLPLPKTVLARLTFLDCCR